MNRSNSSKTRYHKPYHLDQGRGDNRKILVCFSLLFFLTALLGVGLYPTPSKAKVISIKAAPIGTYVKLRDNLLVKANSEGLFISTSSYSYPQCNNNSPVITNTNPSWCSNDSSSTSTLTASLEGIANPICTWSPIVGLSNPTSCTTLASPTSTTTYTVEINGCSSSSTITINPIPPTPTVTNTPSCGGATLVASGNSGSTLYYQGTNSTGTSTSDPSTSKAFTSTSTTNYYWRSLSNTNGCWSEPASATPAIYPIPSIVTVSNSGAQCGSTRTLTASGGSGGTIYYQGTTSNGTSTADTATSKTFSSSSGTVYWRALSSAGCWGDQGSGYATINAIPSAVTIANSGAQCGSTRTLTASGGSGGTIYYQGITSGGTSTADTATSKTFSSSSGTVYWRALSSAGCWGDQGSGYATINAIPSAVTVSTNGVCGTQTLTASGGSGGTIYYQGTTSGGSSTTTASTTAAVSTSGTYYFRARSSAGCWGTQGGVGVTINACVPTTMQNMTKAYCNSMANLATLTLTDTRDSKTYRIRKFADGNCWMIDNLAYGSCTSYSFASSTTVGYCRNNPSSSTYGYLYNWTMAQSVCPSPWYLPPNSGTGSFYTLHTAYSSPTSPNFWANSSYWNGVYAGFCDYSGTLSSQGFSALYWSSTQLNTGYAYCLTFTTYGGVSPQNDSNKNYGYSVRCVL